MNKFGSLPRVDAAKAAATVKAFEPVLLRRKAYLYAELCKQIPDDAELVELVAHGLEPSAVVQFFCAVHLLLLREPNDQLARFFASLTDRPLPPDEAFSDFARFCKDHRGDILQVMRSRTVQVTTVERCKPIMAAIARVTQLTGEPLDLIEIGCSAGVLLVFDKFAYNLGKRGRLGTDDAPLTLDLKLIGGPDIALPRIGQRTGLDLCLVDLNSSDERRWILAQCFPELTEWRKQLVTAMDVIAQTDIRFIEGDALVSLPELLAEAAGPVCIFHSACLLYWTDEAKAQLEHQLLEASRGRDLYRVSNERPEHPHPDAPNSAEIRITHYRDGAIGPNCFVANSSSDFSSLTWLD